MRKETGGVMDALDEEGSFDDGDPYTTNLYIGQHVFRLEGCQCPIRHAHAAVAQV